MKKQLVLVVMMSFVFMFAVGGVIADQTTILHGDGVVDFTLTNLDFDAVIPGTEKTASSTMTLNIANNVDFDLEIYLQDLSDIIFENIELNLLEIGGSATGDLKIGVANALGATVDDLDITDISTEQILGIGGKITIPVGSLPGERTAIIVYSITAPAP